MSKRGFTLLELLVVIAIIGLLASIVVMATMDSRSKAQNAQIYQQLKQIENAFLLYAANHLTVWPDVVTGAFNFDRKAEFNLDILISGSPPSWEGPKRFPDFGDYLQSLPPNPYPSGGYYGYVNYNTPLGTGCSAAINLGVAIRIVGGSSPDRDSLFAYLDEEIDASDGPTCGRVRQQAGEVIMYMIANDPTDIYGIN